MNRALRLAGILALRRDLVLLLAAIVLITTGEELWTRFLPKYLQTLGAGALIIGLFDALRTSLGAIYAYPGGIIVDKWGHRHALVAFTLLSIAGYGLVALIPHWSAVIGGMFLFLSGRAFHCRLHFHLSARRSPGTGTRWASLCSHSSSVFPLSSVRCLADC